MSKFKVTVTFEIIAESLDDAWSKVLDGEIKQALNDIYYSHDDVVDYPNTNHMEEIKS